MREPAVAAPTAEQIEFFEKKIRPVLADRCYQCHSGKSDEIQASLRLDWRGGIHKGGDRGPALVPGKPEASLLVTAIAHRDPDLKMPPDKPLTASQVRDFETWVRMGAPDPRDKAPAQSQGHAGIDYEQAKRHWSLQPPADPPIPGIGLAERAENPIDRFIFARLDAERLAPAPRADRLTLIRRATFDLTGLPPTPEQVEAFVSDLAPDAFARVIDRLLASPHYGEQWGRHWLDVARYADTSGGSTDHPVPTARLYRDYVIDSFNQDKPYDLFLREQIAGDLMPFASEAQRRERIVATGFLALARRFGNNKNVPHLIIDDTLDTIGKSILGLSLACARCHDHKFDPLTSRDYYALYGIFHSTTYPFPGAENPKLPADLVPLASQTEIETLLKPHQKRQKDADKEYDRVKDLTAALQELSSPATPEARERVKKLQAELAGRTPEQIRKKRQQIAASPPPIVMAYAVSDAKGTDARIQKGGEPNKLGDLAPRGFPKVLGNQRLPQGYGGSGRRELAGWLTGRDNPLTARVMVNRIWQHHFGAGLVPTPNDFGTRGQQPTHPELLDYLAARFVQRGWSIKAMHRLILDSRTYQQASMDNESFAARDTDNRLLWKQSRRRLSAESLRDGMLFVSGDLDIGRAGPHPFPPQHQWFYSQHRPFVADYPSRHRSVFLMQQRIRKNLYLDLFNGADPNSSTAVRTANSSPLQALFLLNDAFVHEQARRFGERLLKIAPDDRGRIEQGFRLALGRPPTSDEVGQTVAFLAEYRRQFTDAGTDRAEQAARPWIGLARVLYSSNEFCYVD